MTDNYKKIVYGALFFSHILGGCKQNNTNEEALELIQESVVESTADDDWEWNFEKPDYEEIEKRISDKHSDMYYPKLFARYLKSDTFSLEETRHLYYGHVFQPDYDPYDFGTSNFKDSIHALFDKPSMNSADCRKMILYADSLLQKNPFFVRGMTIKMQMYEQLQDSVSIGKVMARISVIFDAILSSGDGISPETAFHVIITENEYEIVNLMGFTSEGQSLIGTCDYLHLKENPAQLEGLYFDVTPCLKKLGLPI